MIPEPNDNGIMPNIGKIPFKAHEQISHQPLLMAIGMVHNIEKKLCPTKIGILMHKNRN